ncbi:thioesterase domain-containing protein [Roseateles aquatilis]|nr:thioesterase domain-containing protein [Roseateles aquatilis]
MLPKSGRPFRIHDKGSRAPLVMCHAIAGTVFFYYHLQRTGLLQGPLHAIQACGLEDGEEPMGTVQALAARNLQVIAQEQDLESVHLGGYSFGCIVALEMARQLEAAGLTPRPLILLAPSPPTQVTDQTPDAERSAIVEAQTASLLKTALRGMDRLVPRRYKDRLSHLYRTHLQAYHAHRPSAVNCEIAAFVPLGERADSRAAVIDHWRGLSHTRCSVHDAGGDHKTMLRAPHTAPLVRAFESVLREAAEARHAMAAPDAPAPIPALPRRRGAATVSSPAMQGMAPGLAHSARLDEND